MDIREKTQLNKPLRTLSVRVVLLGLALVVTLASCVLMTVAWYTKMVSVTGLEFKTAEWDFTANYAAEGLAVNVYEYSTITSRPVPLAAPGTKGYIPIKLSAWQSNTDISFSLQLDRSSMSGEFQKRIFFYYCTTTDGGNVLSNVETEYKVYLDGSPDNPNAAYELMSGTIERGESVEVMIFWEWLYEDPEHEQFSDEWNAWNEFDTNVGKNPTLYVDEMNAKVSIAGVQIEPGNPINNGNNQT